MSNKHGFVYDLRGKFWICVSHIKLKRPTILEDNQTDAQIS